MVYVNENPPGEFFDMVEYAQFFSPALVDEQAEHLIWYHVDYAWYREEEDRVPVQPKRDRLTAFLRCRVANHAWRKHVISKAMENVMHARSGISKLPAELLQLIICFAA